MHSILSAISHNQGLFTSFLLVAILLTTLYGCNLSEQQRVETVAVLAETAERIVTDKPVDLSRLLLLLGNVLGIGAVIDNRRKDVHIKTLKNNAPRKKG